MASPAPGTPFGCSVVTSCRYRSLALRFARIGVLTAAWWGLVPAGSLAQEPPPGESAPPAAAEPSTAAAESPSPAPASEPGPAAESAPAAAPSSPPSAPVSPAPAAPAPVAVVPATPGDDLARLAEPEVADRLGLSPEQRNQVTQLLASRAQALETATDDAGRELLVADFARLLRSVLDERQLTSWNRYYGGSAAARDQLRFSFRFQPWADVLNWFADRADLSLTLEAPPPGTFNYTDTRAYTTSEALDLLNGVLMTKGYTLVRRERMLLVLNLSQGVPADLIPRVTLDELDERGKFELVTVQFEIGKRPAEEVNAEIKPLLGPFGKSAPLPKTGQLLVTETAGKMRAISAIIESIPEPKTDQPAPRPEPEKPILATYELGPVSPEAALEVLKAILPDMKVAHDPQTGKLLAYALPSQQAAVQTTLEQMRAELPPEQKPVLVLHPLDGADGTQLMTLVKPLLPEAQLLLDSTQARLVAWAKPAEQETIRQSLAGLAGTTTAEGGPRVEVYPLAQAEPATLATLLATLVPRARVVADAKARSLVVLGTSAEQDAVRAAVAQLEGESLPAARSRLEVYPLARGLSANALALLKAQLPEAQITYDEPRERLLVLARAADQQAVEATLGKLTATEAAPAEPVLKVYRPTAERRKQVLAVLGTLASDLPGIRQVSDDETGELAIWARPEQHALIEGVLAELGPEPAADAARRLVVYRLAIADPTAVSQVVQALLPQAKLVVEAKSKQVVVWARDDEQAQVRALVEQMDRAPEPGQQLQLRSHPWGRADATAALGMLRLLVPEAQLVPDAKNQTLIAWAAGADQAMIEEALARLQSEVPERERPKLVIYPAGKATAAIAANVLAPLFPTARFTADAQANHVAAWATPAEHAEVDKAIAQMQSEESPLTRRTLEVYRVDRARSANLATLLASVVPSATVRAEPTLGQIVCWARPEEQELIRQALAELEMEGPPDEERTLAVYPLEGREATTLVSTLQPMFEDVKFTSDPQADVLTAWAKADQHARIRETLARLAAEAPLTTAEGRVYNLKLADPYAAYQTLRSLYPAIPLTIDTRANTVLVVAKPEEHARIAPLIRAIDQPETAVAGQKLAVYPLAGRDPSALVTLLQPAMTDARFVADTTGGNLLVWARPEQQALVAENLRALSDEFANSRRTTEVYRFEHGDAYAAFAVLRQLLPAVPMAPDTKAGTLVVTAAPAEHEQIRAAVEAMDAGGPAAQAQELAVYPTGGRDPSSLVALLQPALPDARFVADARAGNVLVWARPEHQQLIRENLKRLLAADDAGRLTTETYRLAEADPSAALIVLRPLFPYATMAVDPAARTLVATATTEQHGQIRAAIEQMEAAAQAGGEARLVTYELAAAEPANVLVVVRNLFATRPDVRVSLDQGTGKLIVWGRPDDQAQVAQLIRDLEGETTLEASPQVEVYALGDSDAEAVSRIIRQLVERYPDAQIVEDERSNQIVALARPAVQATIRATIEQLRSSAPQSEVFTLRQLDALTAEFAVGRLFGSEGRRGNDSAPKIDSDPDRQQLLVRGSRQQIDEIRALLVKMGESDLALANETGSLDPSGAKGGPRRNVRVLPWAAGRDPAALEALERMWRQVRENPIRVVTPSAVVPTWRGDEAPADEPGDPPPPGSGGADPPADETEPEPAESPAEEPPAGLTPADAGESPAGAEEPSTNGAIPEVEADEPAAGRAPIVIAPGDGTLTIASDDVEALDQLEALVRGLSPESGRGGRDFTVFGLRHVDAVSIADTLQKFFEDRSFGFSTSGGVRIVPDRRLNVIVVRASPNDLGTIAGLIRVLDTPEVATPLAGDAPRRIAVEHTKAREIYEVVRDVYRTQLTSGGAARQLSLPSGLSREFASLISQINQASAGPQMTIAVDEPTNSLVVRAAPALFAEVAQLVEALDQGAENSGRTVRVLSLEHTNTATVESTLEWLLGNPSGSLRRNRGRNSRSGGSSGSSD